MIYWMVYYRDGTCVTELEQHWKDTSLENVKSIALIRPPPRTPVFIDLLPGDLPFQKKTGEARVKFPSLEPLGSKITSHIIGKETRAGSRVKYIVNADTYEVALEVE